MTPRRWFHVVLGAVLLPVVSLPVVWVVAIRTRRRAADDDARRWARRLVWLAALDTIVAVAFVALAALGGDTELQTVGGPIAEARPTDPPIIGVLPDRSFQGRGARIDEVRPGSPAEAAGVRPGDVVVALAGEEIPDFPALRGAVSAQQPGVAVPLVVVRGEARVSLTVTPRRASELFPPSAPPPLPPELRRVACAPHVDVRDLAPLAALVAALAVVGALAWRRARDAGAARAAWWTGGALVVSALAGSALAVGACWAEGGARTPTGHMVALGGATLALGATALAGLRRLPAEEGPAERSWRSAVALGGWYLATGLPRIAALVGAAALVAAMPGDAPVESLVQGLVEARRWLPLLLLAVDVVLLAPVAEEVAFRGLLQPALGRWLGPAGAIAVTSALFASGHWYYGLKLPVIVLVGAVLGWARVASGGLRAPISLHALVNAVNLAALVVLS